MSCERLRAALTDAALGLPAGRELQQHVAGCARCSAEHERQRGLLARIDAAIRSGTDVPVSPALLSRVRQRATQRHSRPWRVHAWLLPLAAGIGVVSLAGPRMWRRPQTTPPAVTSVADQPRPPVQAVPAPAQEPAPPPPSTPTRARVEPARPSEPEVLLRPGEAAFLRRFAESAARQPVRAAALLQAGFDPGNEESAPLRASPIQPLDPPRTAIAPLEQAPAGIAPLAVSREEIRPLTIPPAERPGPGDLPPSERQ